MSQALTRSHFHNRAFKFLKPLAWIVIAGAASQALGEAPPRPEALIKWRQSAFQVISWNTGRIKGALAAGDAQEVRTAAGALAAVANSKFTSAAPTAPAQPATQTAQAKMGASPPSTGEAPVREVTLSDQSASDGQMSLADAARQARQKKAAASTTSPQ